MAMPRAPFRTWRPILFHVPKPATSEASGRWLMIISTLVAEYRWNRRMAPRYANQSPEVVSAAHLDEEPVVGGPQGVCDGNCR